MAGPDALGYEQGEQRYHFWNPLVYGKEAANLLQELDPETPDDFDRKVILQKPGEPARSLDQGELEHMILNSNPMRTHPNVQHVKVLTTPIVGGGSEVAPPGYYTSQKSTGGDSLAPPSLVDSDMEEMESMVYSACRARNMSANGARARRGRKKAPRKTAKKRRTCKKRGCQVRPRNPRHTLCSRHKAKK
jgi:hypothetical protein